MDEELTWGEPVLEICVRNYIEGLDGFRFEEFKKQVFSTVNALVAVFNGEVPKEWLTREFSCDTLVAMAQSLLDRLPNDSEEKIQFRGNFNTLVLNKDKIVQKVWAH